MLLPRFSIRWVLLLTTVCSILFFVAARAVRGQAWAIAFTAAVVFCVASFLLFGVNFLSAYALARATRSLNPPEKPHNPFIHEGAYPPQVVPKGTFGGGRVEDN